jgi:membrane protein CcdC involved in cytochrome C biogenesis
MHTFKRRPRRWYTTSKALLCFIAIPVIAASMLDGINVREIASLLVVLAFGFIIALRADSLQIHLDALEKRLHVRKPH